MEQKIKKIWVLGFSHDNAITVSSDKDGLIEYQSGGQYGWYKKGRIAYQEKYVTAVEYY